MSNYQAGHDAEMRAAEYLEGKGYKILQLNWKTRYCEIDIIAKRNDTVYFVEVKYRKTGRQGSGLDYITSAKLRKMTFAAEMWVATERWGGDYQLAAIGMDGDKVTFIDEI